MGGGVGGEQSRPLEGVRYEGKEGVCVISIVHILHRFVETERI